MTYLIKSTMNNYYIKIELNFKYLFVHKYFENHKKIF